MTDSTAGTDTAAAEAAASQAALAAALAATDAGAEGDDPDGSKAAAAAAEAAKEGDEPAEGTDAAVAALTAQVEAIKAEARKWEERSKANFKELEAIKRNGMSDEEKAAHDAAAVSQAVTEATERAEKAEAALLRKTIAVDLSLSPEHAAVLDGITGDETALRAVAAALAAAKPEAKPEKKGVVPTQGTATAGTGTQTLGEQFADALEGFL